jgi:hypothetical protein
VGVPRVSRGACCEVAAIGALKSTPAMQYRLVEKGHCMEQTARVSADITDTMQTNKHHQRTPPDLLSTNYQPALP